MRAFDTRPEVKEQVQSMWAEYLELDFKQDQARSDGYAKEDVLGFYSSGNGFIC